MLANNSTFTRDHEESYFLFFSSSPPPPFFPQCQKRLPLVLKRVSRQRHCLYILPLSFVIPKAILQTYTLSTGSAVPLPCSTLFFPIFTFCVANPLFRPSIWSKSFLYYPPIYLFMFVSTTYLLIRIVFQEVRAESLILFRLRNTIFITYKNIY